jgi:flagellar L-ring protein precursor FlgH
MFFARSRSVVVIAVAALAVMAAGCAIKKKPIAPKLASDLDLLDQQMAVLPPFPAPTPDSGSLWTDGGPGAALTRDTRAFRVNDLVTIELRETSAGSNGSTTDLSKSSEANFAAPYVMGLENFDRAFEAEFGTEFSGDGQTARSSKLTGTITTRVRRVLPNGDLVVAGQKMVMVNRERQVLTLVGSVRPVDISRSNRVLSSEVGDLTVRMWGNGEVDDTIRQGWFMRVMHMLWPF